MKYSELPPHERPSFRMERHGPESLSNAELLSLMLGIDDTETAYAVLSESRGAENLFGMSRHELAKAGLSEAQADVLLASAGLMARVRAVRASSSAIEGPVQIAEMFYDVARHAEQESIHAVSLDAQGRVNGVHEVAKGGVNMAGVNLSDIFRPAIRDGAASVVLVHNHPSGMPEPSQDDRALTVAAANAGQVFGIPLVDHVVVGREDFTSLKKAEAFLWGASVEDRFDKEKAAKLGFETASATAPPVGLVRSKERDLRGEYAAAARGPAQDAGHEV